MSTEILSAIESIGRNFEDFKRHNDDRLKEIEKKGSADVLLEDKVNRLNSAITELEAFKKQLEVELTKSGRFGAQGNEGDRAKEEYRKAFDLYVRKRKEHGLDELQRKTYATDVGADGAYFVPEVVSSKILELMIPVSPIRSLANSVTVSTAAYKVAVDLGGIAGGWVAQKQTRGETDTGTVGEIEAKVNELYAMPPVTQDMLDDAAFDVESWIARKVADKFTSIENVGFMSGTGAGDPKGVLSYPTAATADGSRAFGTIEHVVTGVSGDFAATAKHDVLLDLTYKFKAGMLQGAAWAMRGSTIGAVRKLKDGQGNYLWQPGLVAGGSPLLHGYPVVQVDDMPAIAANSLSIALANWKRAYTVIDRIGTRLLRDPITKKGWVLFYTTKRVGGTLEDSEAIKFIKFA